MFLFMSVLVMVKCVRMLTQKDEEKHPLAHSVIPVEINQFCLIVYSSPPSTYINPTLPSTLTINPIPPPLPSAWPVCSAASC